MKSLISKLRNKKLKGNVSLLIILVLLASSVIALLSINQIQRLLTYGNMTFNYFRSFYLAKAGTELGLTEVYYREAGFKQTINSGDAIITENLVGAYSGFNPYFTMDIEGNFQYLTNDVRYTTKNDCTDDNMITLGTGEGIMLSLFSDETKSFNEIFIGTNEDNLHSNNNLIKKLKMVNVENGGDFKYFIFGLFDYDKNGDMKNIFVETGDSLYLTNKFLGHIDDKGINNSKRRYLTIKNPGTGNEIVSFCIYMNDKLIPYSDSLITVRGNYGDMEVGLQSVVKKEIPFWAMDVLGL